MNITWVFADDAILGKNVNLDMVRRIGPTWGSWRTWRAYTTDNVVCHDMRKADELIKREFNKSCNFYVSNSAYTSIGRPSGVRVYEGDFMGHDVDNQDEIVAMNLAGSQSDIVILLGFDLSPREEDPDKIRELRARNHRGLILQAIKNLPNVQWILLDHPGDISQLQTEMPNLDKDSFMNVLRLLRG